MAWWSGLALLAVLYWSAVLVLVLRCVRAVPPISVLHDPAPPSWPRLSIVVPAKNEAKDIAAAVRSKLACGYPNLQVVTVDDRSTDGTGEILDRLAKADGRLTVVHVTELPAGWLGKLHAMERGRALATGEWVLFSDADVMLDAGTLGPLIAHAEAQRIDLVAVLPGLDAQRWGADALLASFMRAISLLGRMWRANDDRSPIGIGVGAFNLVRRRALDQTPGLAFLRLEIADDVALGAMLKASGARCRLFAGRRDVHLGFYATLGAAARSWEKFGTVFEFTLWRPFLFVALLLAVELGFPLLGIFTGGAGLLLGACAWLAAGLAHLLLARHLSLPWRGALLWPLGSLLLALLLMRAAWVTWRAQGIDWRGTFYPRAELLEGRRYYAGRIIAPDPEARSGRVGNLKE